MDPEGEGKNKYEKEINMGKELVQVKQPLSLK